MDNKLLVSRVERYNFSSSIQCETKNKKRSQKRRNKTLKWVDVRSEEFKSFVKTLKHNYQLTNKDEAGTLGWARLPFIKKQKHMEHGKYIVAAEYFKNAKAFMKLGKEKSMIDGYNIAIFEKEVPDTVFEGERDESNTNQKFFSESVSTQKKRKIIEPIKHSTLLRKDVSSDRIINENDNVKYHFLNQGDKIKKSLVHNDEILNKIVKKLKSIMQKNGEHEKKLVGMENEGLHIHSGVETKSVTQKEIEESGLKLIDTAKSQSESKVPYRDFGVVYDTEDKQFMHKLKVIRI